jgi:hypothetical protein
LASKKRSQPVTPSSDPRRHYFILAGLLLLLLGVLALRWYVSRPSSSSTAESDKRITEIAQQVLALADEEKRVAQAVWPKELLAEQCGRVFEQFWDNLNGTSDKFTVLTAFPFGEILGPQFGPPRSLPHSIQLRVQSGGSPAWTPATWKTLMDDASRAGWQVAQTEFRQIEFDTDPAGRPAWSRYYFSAHLINPTAQDRAILEGEFRVTWQAPIRADQLPAVIKIEANGVTLRQRHGDPGFREILTEDMAPLEGSFFVDPLIVYDLDGDGTPEIILAAKNLVFRRQANGSYGQQPLCRVPPGLIFTGVIADFDGDGVADFLCAKFEGLYLFKGSPQGTFDEPGRLVWAAKPHLKYGQALTCGDIDGDGDLDVWIGQYKVPYDRGQMPTPYYDANDGYPSYLLVNDGQGNFTDATATSGLGQKRWRRAYSASFISLRTDQPPALVVASDFAGLDVYTNDGHGHFTDESATILPERHAFGMCQLSADFNGDGLQDLLMIGMNVPVAERLQHFGQGRPGFDTYFSMIGPMTDGNRLFLGEPDGRFRLTGLNDAIAHTGWSWGASAFDFDNDGYPDLYVANGHETKQTVRDYETEFWLHDLYVGNSQDNLVAFAYFQNRIAETRGHGMSYGGYERNRLFLNQSGVSFVEIGHLMGVALPADSRNVVGEDLDGDGRPDLLVTTFEVWPRNRQVLHVFQNALPETGNWISFRLREQGHGVSPVGARVTIQYGGKTATQQIAVGQGYRSQQSTTVQFGLGRAAKVDGAEIRWSNGRKLVLRGPAINRAHAVLGENAAGP